MKRAADGTGVAVRLIAAGALCWVPLVADQTAPALAIPLVLASSTGTRGYELLPLVIWLGGGSAVGGLVGWAVATVLVPTATLVGLGFGLAAGGGLGVALKLAVIDSQEPEAPETVTVEMGEGDGDGDATREPQPVDLFEAHPDPLLYYEDEGTGPVVRAVNDAFVEAFGVTATSVEDAALGDASMVATRRESVVDAATDGEPFDAVLDCETGDGTVTTRVRVISTGARGYVLYSPVDHEQ